MQNYKLIGRGNTSEVYKYEEEKVVKLFHPNQSQSTIEREYEINMKINNLQIAPKILGRTKQNGRTGLIYEYINGRNMLEEVIRKPWKLIYYSKLLAKIHTGIHKSTIIGIPDQIECLVKNIHKTDLLTNDEKRIIIKKLKLLPENTVLCHGDLHPQNVIVSKGNTVVIDWVNATLGNPIGDFARTLIMLRYAQPADKKTYLQKLFFKFLRRIPYFVYKRSYKRLTGVTDEELSGWILPIAAARLYEKIPQAERKILLNLIRKNL